MLNCELCGVEFSYKDVTCFLSGYVEQKTCTVYDAVMILSHRLRYFRNDRVRKMNISMSLR